MHEIEVKGALDDKDAFISRLIERGCELGPETVQKDTVFVRDTGSIETYLSNDDFLRLREENGQTFFTLKNHPGRTDSLHTAPLELELTVSSRDVMEQILSYMGYQEAVRIHKRRRKGRYGNWEVCVDEVEGLGCFVELEELAEKSDEIEDIQKRMKVFLAELGVQTGDQIRNRYDILLLQEKYREGGVV